MNATSKKKIESRHLFPSSMTFLHRKFEASLFGHPAYEHMLRSLDHRQVELEPEGNVRMNFLQQLFKPIYALDLRV